MPAGILGVVPLPTQVTLPNSCKGGRRKRTCDSLVAAAKHLGGERLVRLAEEGATRLRGCGTPPLWEPQEERRILTSGRLYLGATNRCMERRLL